MKLGAIFPHDNIEPDAGGIRAYAEEGEEMGFRQMMCYDDVIGANAGSRPGWTGGELEYAV